VRKHILIALASAVITGFCCQPASAQLPGSLKLPKVSKPKPKPTPTDAAQPSLSGESQPAPSSESRPAAASAQPQPTSGATATTPVVSVQPLVGFDKGWLVVRTLVVSSYKGNFDIWSWTPVVEFRDRGNLPSGAKYYAEFMQPNGSPWIKLACEQNGDAFTCIDRDDSKGATYAGLIPFAVKLRNPLQGTEQTVFTGKAKVEKAPSSDVERNKLSYYVNHDWALPIGYVFRRYDGHLGFAIWLHTDNSSGLEPHVFYNGAEVGLATLNGEPVGHAGCGESELEAWPSRDVASSLANKGKWVRVGCDFTNVYWGDEEHTQGVHLINRHPGEYEIKVLWKGRLARSIKFTVNPDGSINDAGIAANGFSTDRVMVPVKVIGAQDGTWDQNAWRTEAFYGNPPQGFTPAP
jgi:hypothetical protein